MVSGGGGVSNEVHSVLAPARLPAGQIDGRLDTASNNDGRQSSRSRGEEGEFQHLPGKLTANTG